MVESHIGRPVRKEEYYSADDLPRDKGAYVIRDQQGDTKYVGMTNNVERRMQEHRRTGMYEEGQQIVFHRAHPNTGQPTLARHEDRLINKEKPYANSRKSGGGRPWE